MEYDQLRMDIELVPSKLYTTAKPLSKRGERFLRDRYIANDEGHVLLRALGGFRRAADGMGLRVGTPLQQKEKGPAMGQPEVDMNEAKSFTISPLPQRHSEIVVSSAENLRSP